MSCAIELLRTPFVERTIFQLLTPSEQELAVHPRSTLYIRNCFFERLDSITLDVKPTSENDVTKLMFKSIEALLKNPLKASILPTWTLGTDFQYMNIAKMDLTQSQIYFNVNMDSPNKYLFVLPGGLCVILKHTGSETWLARAKSGLPYKLKTLKKDLGIK